MNPTVGDLAKQRVEQWCAGAKANTRWIEAGKRWAIDLIEDFGLAMASDPLLNWEIPVDKLKGFLRAMLPTLKFIASLTSTTADDQFVAFLEAWLAQTGSQPIHEFAKTYLPPKA